MNYFFLFSLLSIYISYSSSLSIEEVLEEERSHSPVAQRLWDQAAAPNVEREATMRSHTPPRPSLLLTSSTSPSQIFSPLQREQAALVEFLDYSQSHLPTRAHLKLSNTPLNSTTVLAAALKRLRVGNHSHYRSYTFFSVDPHSFQESQMVLQMHFDLHKKDLKGRTNLERMQQGRSPLGADDKRINLHHINQEDGLLAEMNQRTHKKFHGILHFRTAKGTSRVDRRKFRSFRRAYWKHRATQVAPSSPSALKELFK